MTAPLEIAVDPAGSAAGVALDDAAPAVTVELRPHIRMQMAEQARDAPAEGPDAAGAR